MVVSGEWAPLPGGDEVHGPEHRDSEQRDHEGEHHGELLLACGVVAFSMGR
jgi:hypothetical protein